MNSVLLFQVTFSLTVADAQAACLAPIREAFGGTVASAPTRGHQSWRLSMALAEDSPDGGDPLEDVLANWRRVAAQERPESASLVCLVGFPRDRDDEVANAWCERLMEDVSDVSGAAFRIEYC